jgi:UDP:flavonoid glycosyltransferase YjiC (YdhE family)
MATILFTWELGGGYGHLMLMAAIGRSLRDAGHRVVVATKDVASAHQVFAKTGIELLPTPHSQTRVLYPRQQSFAHLLANIGFADPHVLHAHTTVWQSLYHLIQPDLTLFVHSPTALLAARGTPMRKAVIGSGFFIPPDAFPLPAFRADAQLDWNQLKSMEEGLLQNANDLLQSWNQPPLERIAQLYAQVDRIFLTTYQELEHYPNREPSTQYWGTIDAGDVDGQHPVWPSAPGKKIYAYLKNFPSLRQLLQVIADSSQPALIYSDTIDAATRERFSSSTVRFETNRLNLAKAADQCDLAITHATLGTTAILLRESKPLLLLPLTEEQGIIARSIEKQGAGLSVLMDQPSLFGLKLKKLLEDPALATGAARLAERLKQIDLAERQERLVNQVLSLL